MSGFFSSLWGSDHPLKSCACVTVFNLPCELTCNTFWQQSLSEELLRQYSAYFLEPGVKFRRCFRAACVLERCRKLILWLGLVAKVLTGASSALLSLPCDGQQRQVSKVRRVQSNRTETQKSPPFWINTT